MNPYTLIAIGVVYLASLIGVGFWQHDAGRDAQKADDQGQFDAINAKLAKQTTEANARFRAAQADIIALQADRDTLKTNLAKEKQTHDKKTADLHAYYADRGLRYAAKGSGCGGSGGRAESAAGNTAGNETTAIVQLPDSITRSLRQLALAADQLADDYRLCYGYANQVK